MPVLKGKKVSDGKTTGRLMCLNDDTCNVSKTKAFDPQKECLRFQKACADAMNQLQASYERALNKVGEQDAKIFVIQQMMIHEQCFIDDVKAIINSEIVTAQSAVAVVAAMNIEILESTEDDYMKARAADIRDVSQRIIRILTNTPDFSKPWGKNLVLYKNAITPSELIRLNPQNIKAIITHIDSYYSHSAILARTMKIPYITEISEEIINYDKRNVIIDTELETVTIE